MGILAGQFEGSFPVDMHVFIVAFIRGKFIGFNRRLVTT